MSPALVTVLVTSQPYIPANRAFSVTRSSAADSMARSTSTPRRPILAAVAVIQTLMLVRALQYHQATHFQRNIAQRRPGGVEIGRPAAHKHDIHMRRGATARRDRAQPGEIVVAHLAAQKARKERH